MKAECITTKFQNAISKAERVTGKNLTLPILGYVLIEAKSNTITFKSTNLDIGVEITIPAKVEEPGIIAVPGSILNNFISNLSDEKNIKLEIVDGNLSVSSQFSATVIKSIPHDDFPIIPKVDKDKTFSIHALDFIKGLRSVWYSSATSSMKPELSSVYIYPDDEGMVFVATDSFRLAEKRVKVKKAPVFNHILIPFKNIPEIIKVLEDVEGEIEVSLGKTQLSLISNGVYLVSRIIDGMFPDYKQIIPKESKTEVITLKQDLINSLKISNIFSDKFHQINIKADPKERVFELKTKNNEVGENVNRLQAALNGESVDINFNYKYIIDCFQSIDADSVSLNFNGLNRPMIIRGVTDKTFMYLVMPMNR